MSVYQRGTIQANASLTSMLQRFSDIFIMFLGLYLSCAIFDMSFDLTKMITILIGLVIFQMIGGITDFYRSWRGVRGMLEIKAIFINWTISFILSMFILSVFNISDGEYIFRFNWYWIVLIGLIAGRFCIRLALAYLRKIGYNTRNVAIMGSLPIGIHLAETLNEAHWMGFNVLGIYSDEVIPSSTHIPFCGDLATLVKDAEQGKIDRIYIAMSMSTEMKIRETVAKLTDTKCSVLLIPDMFTSNILQSRHEEINGVPVISLFDTPMSGINAVIKQIEDRTLALFILLFISPVLLAIAVLVKLTSEGPVIFKQQRYGIDGKAIEVWKFRSMKVMENGNSVIQAKKGDARVTKLGAFLRRTSLDELPQFINVLKGDMSIVGPRPHAVAHNEQYRKLINGYMLRHRMKPGITGWAQINGWRGETDTLDKMEKRVEYDLEYIRNWSVWFDIKIIFLTVFKGFVNKAAY
ncbi:undecaprenyl-phosphate glucose phosphotransferase [Serratia sp. NPDC078593]|uniref:undecaprenyl-phosphate glucose phosphotransferase n=1 Tax=unclassified Serratia (in: enterobacteria) TaxID=2647522 RepID=UPI0037D59E9E